MKKIIFILILVLISIFGSSCGPALVVNSAGDEPDTDLTDGTFKTINNDCTLRAAILEDNVSDDVSKITFSNVTQINQNRFLF